MSQKPSPPKSPARTITADVTAYDTYIFDLDNTLYPSACNLFAQVDRNIGAYISRTLNLDPLTARRIQKHYFQQYGTTLRGLMTEHGVDADDYLAAVHDIDLGAISADARLDAALDALPGRKVIFTNASRHHAERVTDKLGIGAHFDAIFDIVAADFVPKPNRPPYDGLVARLDINPARALYFEDMARNLFPAKEMGMGTVLVETEHPWAREGMEDRRIDHVTDDLAGFLGQPEPD